MLFIGASDPNMVYMYVVDEQLYAPHWHPTLTAPVRPYWTNCLPSSAALSFNFAIEQYTQPRDIFYDLSAADSGKCTIGDAIN